MAVLHEYEMSYKNFLDKSTIIYGKTGSGKSFIIRDILYHLQAHVKQIMVFSPTNRQNHSYSGIAPEPCIHYDFDVGLLETIYERQMALVEVSSQADNADSLNSLFARCTDKHLEEAAIAKIKASLQENKSNAGNDPTKAAALEQKCHLTIKKIMRAACERNWSMLSAAALSHEEKVTLNYLQMNPKMVLVFDDCTDILKKVGNSQIIQKLFYQGRHLQITIIVAAHTDKALLPEIKKNTFVRIFTESTEAQSYFSRTTTTMTKADTVYATQCCQQAFSPVLKYQKLVWDISAAKFYKYTATPRDDFKFGAQAIWDYCGKLKTEGHGMINNSFIHEFFL